MKKINFKRNFDSFDAMLFAVISLFISIASLLLILFFLF